jgi:hypothetical protein
MTKDEALKMALEALKLINLEFVCGNGSHNAKKDRHEWDEDCPITNRWREAITAIKEALAQPEQEPAAWMYPDDLKRFETSEAYAEAYSIEMGSPTKGKTVPLYPTPPQRTWVGLAPKDFEKIEQLYGNKVSNDFVLSDIISMTQAKLKEKNEY